MQRWPWNHGFGSNKSMGPVLNSSYLLSLDLPTGNKINKKFQRTEHWHILCPARFPILLTCFGQKHNIQTLFLRQFGQSFEPKDYEFSVNFLFFRMPEFHYLKVKILVFIKQSTHTVTIEFGMPLIDKAQKTCSKTWWLALIVFSNTAAVRVFVLEYTDLSFTLSWSKNDSFCCPAADFGKMFYNMKQLSIIIQHYSLCQHVLFRQHWDQVLKDQLCRGVGCDLDIHECQPVQNGCPSSSRDHTSNQNLLANSKLTMEMAAATETDNN